jgi:hypothetical protein
MIAALRPLTQGVERPPSRNEILQAHVHHESACRSPWPEMTMWGKTS